MLQVSGVRRSKLRHTLAVLRDTIGLGQKEMAALVDCSPATIQSIELNSGRLKLSESLGEKISHATGVDLKWLMDNDTRKPIVNASGESYTRESFEQCQADLSSLPSDDLSIDHLKFGIDLLLAELFGIYVDAVKKRKLRLVHYKFAKWLGAAQKEMGLTVPKPFDDAHFERWVGGKDRVIDSEKYDAQWIAEIFWTELRREVKAMKRKQK